jgi:hypothetical protein
VLPRGLRPALGIDGATGETVEARVSSEPAGDPLQEARRVDTVVVGEADHVALELAERLVARSREPAVGAKPLDDELRMARKRPGEPPVVVLVDDEYAEPSVGLRVERVEEALELGDAADRGDDEIEGKRRRGEHAP